jgi:hypothetical protein
MKEAFLTKDVEEKIEKLCLEIRRKLKEPPKKEAHPFFRKIFNNTCQRFAYTCNISSLEDQAFFLSEILDDLLPYSRSGKKTAGISVKFCIEVVRDLIKRDKNFLSKYLTRDFLMENEENIWAKDRR